MTTIVLPITLAQAKELTGRIKRSAEVTWKLLEEAHARKAWQPLGYRSFKAYAEAEFGMSESNAHRLLNQAHVTKALNAAAGGSPTPARGSPTTRQAERIKPHLPEATDEVIRRTEAGEPPEEVVAEVIQTYGAPHKTEPEGSPEVEEPDDGVAPETHYGTTTVPRSSTPDVEESAAPSAAVLDPGSSAPCPTPSSGGDGTGTGEQVVAPPAPGATDEPVEPCCDYRDHEGECACPDRHRRHRL